METNVMNLSTLLNEIFSPPRNNAPLRLNRGKVEYKFTKKQLNTDIPVQLAVRFCKTGYDAFDHFKEKDIVEMMFLINDEISKQDLERKVKFYDSKGPIKIFSKVIEASERYINSQKPKIFFYTSDNKKAHLYERLSGYLSSRLKDYVFFTTEDFKKILRKLKLGRVGSFEIEGSNPLSKHIFAWVRKDTLRAINKQPE